MLIKVFTLRFESALAGFDDGPVRDYLKDKEVLSVRDHFFEREGVPYLALLVTYNLTRPEVPAEGGQGRIAAAEKRDDWRTLLEEADWPLFNELRDWRNRLAKEEGVPPYVICTNRQLAEVAHERPPTLAKLHTVEGLGKAKLERYGAALLALVADQVEPPETEAADSDGGPDDAGNDGT